MAKPNFLADGRFVVTLEEGILLTIGILFGWFAGKGASMLILLIPIGLLIVFVFEYFYFIRRGIRPRKKK